LYFYIFDVKLHMYAKFYDFRTIRSEKKRKYILFWPKFYQIVYFGKKIERIKIKKNSKTVSEFSEADNSIDISLNT
jgi:hypothetical protein